MRTSLLFVCLATVAAGCGSSDKTITVSGRTLKVAEQNYGTGGDLSDTTGAFCMPLVSKQFEILITDFAFCAGANKKQANNSLFHSTDEYNLRLITPGPSLLQKNPNGTFKTNDFKVASTANCTGNPNSAQAVAFFSHNSGAKYDLNLEATDGTISITAYDGQSDLQGTYDLVFAGEHVLGTFDLTFGSDHVTGSFDALFCSGLTAAYGS